MNDNRLALAADVVLMCGCPITRDGLWDSDGYEVRATITRRYGKGVADQAARVQRRAIQRRGAGGALRDRLAFGRVCARAARGAGPPAARVRGSRVWVTGAAYGAGYYVALNSLLLPWAFGDPAPWRLGVATIADRADPGRASGIRRQHLVLRSRRFVAESPR